MPADTNQYGDTFGGWLLGQMDIAGGIFAAGLAKGRTATVAVDRNDVPQSRVRRRRHVARKRKEMDAKFVVKVMAPMATPRAHWLWLALQMCLTR
jgi:hypothetical protein